MDANQRRAERRKYRAVKTARKVEWMKNHVEQNIKDTLVINLSSEEVPNIAYMYLAKGLNFVENRTVAKEDLLFDAKEFLRKRMPSTMTPTDNYPQEMKNALYEFTDLIFSESFIHYKGEGYSNKEGIPTSNCISRQVVGVTMHWVRFKQINKKLKNWSLIDLWK